MTTSRQGRDGLDHLPYPKDCLWCPEDGNLVLKLVGGTRERILVCMACLAAWNADEPFVSEAGLYCDQRFDSRGQVIGPDQLHDVDDLPPQPVSRTMSNRAMKRRTRAR